MAYGEIKAIFILRNIKYCPKCYNNAQSAAKHYTIQNDCCNVGSSTIRELWS